MPDTMKNDITAADAAKANTIINRTVEDLWAVYKRMYPAGNMPAEYKACVKRLREDQDTLWERFPDIFAK